MKKIVKYPITAALMVAFLCAGSAAFAAESTASVVAQSSPKVGVVNFKQCVEVSKLGKQEQNSFEALKKQAEQVLQNKEKDLDSLAAKLNDPDYLDSLTPEAEAELKHKFRSLSQELNQQQQQLYQTLSQANFKIVQKLTEEVAKSAEAVAKKMGLDLVINEDACFYYTDKLDISKDVVKALDDNFDAQSK